LKQLTTALNAGHAELQEARTAAAAANAEHEASYDLCFSSIDSICIDFKFCLQSRIDQQAIGGIKLCSAFGVGRIRKPNHRGQQQGHRCRGTCSVAQSPAAGRVGRETFAGRRTQLVAASIADQNRWFVCLDDLRLLLSVFNSIDLS
jgi:hypothetical protein